MKSNKKIWIAAVLTASILLLLFLWLTPKYFLSGVAPETITSIAVKDKATGKNYSITDTEKIIAITKLIQSQPFKKTGISLFSMGTSYQLTFYDESSKILDEFTVNSSDTIRQDPFFYKTSPELTSLPDEIKSADNTPRTLTIEEVYALSQKETISWADLSAYSHSQDFGSGISIHLFPIEEHFYLMVGGVHSDKENSDEPLFYVRLCYQSEDDSSADNEEIDILTGDVKEFYESHKK